MHVADTPLGMHMTARMNAGSTDPAATTTYTTVGASQAVTRAAATESRPDIALGASTAVFIALGGVLPLTLVDWSNIQGDPTNIVLAWLVVLFSAGNIAYIWAVGEPAIVRASFYIFTYIFMGLAVLAQVTSNQFPLYLPGVGGYSTRTIRRALIAVLAGVLVFHVSNRAVAAFRKTSDNIARRGPDRIISENAAIVLGLTGLTFTALLIARTGVGPFFQSWQARTNAQFGLSQSATTATLLASSKAVGGALRFAAQGAVLLSLCAILYKKRTKTWRRGSKVREVGAQALTLVLIIACVVINNPISNSRFWFGLVCVALGSLIIPFGRPSGIRWAITLATCALLFAFTLLQAFRFSGGPKDYSQGPREDLITSSTYSAFTMELVGLRWLETNSHTYGRQFLGPVLVFVPRSAWSSKPVDTGNLILPYANPAASAWTEGEVEGGLVGIAVVFAAIGVGAEALDRQLVRSSSTSVARVLVPVAGGFLIFALRGSFLAAAPSAYVLLICMIMIGRHDRNWRAATVARPTHCATGTQRRLGPDPTKSTESA